MRDQLAAARVARGLSQSQAGALIGKTQSHYSKIERGAVGLSASEALTLCENLGLSLSQLLTITQ